MGFKESIRIIGIILLICNGMIVDADATSKDDLYSQIPAEVEYIRGMDRIPGIHINNYIYIPVQILSPDRLFYAYRKYDTARNVREVVLGNTENRKEETICSKTSILDSSFSWPDWSSDSRTLLYAINKSDNWLKGNWQVSIILYDIESKQSKEILQLEGEVNSVLFSKDGKCLLFIVNNTPGIFDKDVSFEYKIQCRVYDIAHKKYIFLSETYSGKYPAYAISYLGDTINEGCFATDKDVFYFNTETGKTIKLNREPISHRVILQCSPKGRKVAYVDDNSIFVYDIDLKKEEKIMPGRPSVIAWSPDGRFLLFHVAVGRSLNPIRYLRAFIQEDFEAMYIYKTYAYDTTTKDRIELKRNDRLLEAFLLWQQ